MDATTVEAVKAKHPGKELFLLKAAGYEAIAKSPGAAEMQLFRDQASQDKTKPRALERLVRACIVHPAPEELALCLEAKPGLIESWGGKLLEEAGVSEEAEVKKL